MNDRVIRVSAALACAAALLPALPAVAADDAAALLAKHQAYVGWHEGDGVVKTLRETGSIKTGDKVEASISLLRYGIALRRTFIDDRGIEDDEGFTGTVYWTTSFNGFTLRPVGEVARFYFDRDALLGELTSTMPAQVLRHEQVDGVDTVVVHLTPAVGFPMNVFVDPATGAYKRATIDPDGKYETAYNGLAYTEVDGKRFLSSYHIANSKTITTLTKIEVNAPVTTDELHPPKQTAKWTFGEGTTPVELTDSTYPRILIDIAMNGVKGKFILDTGAAHTVLVESFAKQIGAKPFAPTKIFGIGGSSAGSLYRLDSIEVGPSALHNVIVSSGLDERWRSASGVVGLIGFDLLAGAIVDLDFDAKTLRVEDPAKVEPNQTLGIVVHADFSQNHIKVPMKLNGKYDVMATLDSGNPINVLFSRDLVDREHLVFFVNPSILGSTRYGGGVGSGYEIEHCGKLSSLELGPITYQPVPACDSGFESRNEILVGLDFMKAFNYVFDYPDGLMVMVPRKQ